MHTDFLRASLTMYVYKRRPDKREQTAFWWPYPTHQSLQKSYLVEYLDKSYDLCLIARDMSQSLFRIDRRRPSADEQVRVKETFYERLRTWGDALPTTFTIEHEPPPYILLLKMRYHTLVINLFLYHDEDEILGSTTGVMKTPESPTTPSPYNKRNITQSAARAIAVLTRQYWREFGLAYAHHFAIYAVNLALFVLVEQCGTFDILDSDFLSLASAYSTMASRSHIGRNMFHLFRQNVRAKCQGSRLRHSNTVIEEIKTLFDEECTSSSVFDEFSDGLEKLDADERYRVLGAHRLSDMLDRYETLSLGKDEIALGRCFERLAAG